MKNALLLALLLLSVLVSYAQSPSPHVPNQIILSFSNNSTQVDRQEVIDDLGTIIQGLNTSPNGTTEIQQFVLVLVSGYPVVVDDVEYLNEIDLISTIHSHHGKVDGADLNYELTAEQYNFNAFLGANNLEAFSPISASCEANYPGGPLEGGIEPSEATIKVGVLDTGLDPYYPTINQYVVAEVNVLTDDVDPTAGVTISVGYDPANPVAPDDNGHGTAVTGIIAGLSDRAGIKDNNLELYIIKCFDEHGNASMFNLMQAMRISKALQLDVLNLSWSYLTVKEDEHTNALEDAIEVFATTDNGIIVAGAGNDRSDLDVDAYAPASMPNMNNLITVAGTVGEDRNCGGGLAAFSNYGEPAEIAAPAASISAPGLNGFWAVGTSGTSFAAPIVTAAVIQVWMVDDGQGQNLNPGDTHPVAQKVMNTATYVPVLDGSGVEGVVNFQAACHGPGLFALQSGENQGGEAEFGTISINPGLSVAEGEDFQVAPNPFYTHLAISFGSDADAPAYVELLTLQGAKIVETYFDQPVGTTRINVPTDLPAGPYLLRVRQQGKVSAQMVIKN
ncbi:MAG: S8 family serine peptidase [Bacteroidota bacterium]